MKRIFVIADDLTGAAEIGGIAVRHGLTAAIHHVHSGLDGHDVRISELRGSQTQTLIIDSDTRKLPAADAATKIRAILEQIDSADFDLVYKKTDSMLRGPVAAELAAAMTALRHDRALFVPQNPSRKRIIENGHYFIDGVPLHESSVAVDVEYPAATADVRLLLDPAQKYASQKLDIRCVSPAQTDLPKGISIGQATNAEHIQKWTAQRNAKALLAGGADFFTALLESVGLAANAQADFIHNPKDSITIFGSASSPSRRFVSALSAAGVTVCDIPLDPAVAHQLHEQILRSLKSAGRAFAAARGPVSPTRTEQMRENMAEVITQLFSTAPTNTLLIEGGSTASAIMQRLGWTAFNVQAELAPGIVALVPAALPSTVLILKPGNYPWPQGLMPEIA